MFSWKKKQKIPDKPTPFFTNEVLENDNWEIGDFTYGIPEILHWGENAKLKIGRFCSIAEEVKIFLGGNHRIDWFTTYPFNSVPYFKKEGQDIMGHPTTKGDVEIGNDVWIGLGAVIMSGVKIGDGAVIGAYSILTKSVEPYEIVAGNPAKHIRYRFDQERIDFLKKIKWWDFPEDQIRKLIPFLSTDDFETLDEKIKRY